MPGSVTELVAAMLTRIEEDVGRSLVKRAFGYPFRLK